MYHLFVHSGFFGHYFVFPWIYSESILQLEVDLSILWTALSCSNSWQWACFVFVWGSFASFLKRLWCGRSLRIFKVSDDLRCIFFLRSACFQGSPVTTNAYRTSQFVKTIDLQNYRPRQKEIQWDKYVFIRRDVTVIKWEEIHLGETAVI